MSPVKPSFDAARRGGHWHAAPAAPSWTRSAAAWVLRAASDALDRQARRLEAARPDASFLIDGADLEFHAQAGAPEGALYVDGVFVGWLPVTRL
jgi:hypothetical protein